MKCQLAALALIGAAYGSLIAARPSGWLALILSAVLALVAIAAGLATGSAAFGWALTWRRWITLLALGYGAVVAGRWLIAVVAMWAWPDGEVHALTDHVLPSFDLRVLLAVAVFTPVIEEVAFRGLLFDLVGRDRHSVAAIALTSAAFALVHWLVLGPGAIPPMLWLGVVLGTLRALSGGIALPVALHLLNNLVAELIGLG